jgi:curved DNA-binding protein
MMTEPHLVDHYEALQVSPHADRDTIDRVYRHLAKRFHPDNQESGDADRFATVADAHRVLVDPEQRARYDVQYDRVRQARWRVFDQVSTADDVVADRRIREAILAVLYTARRNDADRPGLGIIDLERLLGCPEEHMKFHLWYLRENGWIQRLESGLIAITASGVDRVLDNGGPARNDGHPLLLGNGNPAASGSPARRAGAA